MKAGTDASTDVQVSAAAGRQISPAIDCWSTRPCCRCIQPGRRPLVNEFILSVAVELLITAMGLPSNAAVGLVISAVIEPIVSDAFGMPLTAMPWSASITAAMDGLSTRRWSLLLRTCSVEVADRSSVLAAVHMVYEPGDSGIELVLVLASCKCGSNTIRFLSVLDDVQTIGLQLNTLIGT